MGKFSVVVFGAVVALAACAQVKDEPTQEQVAMGIQAAFNDAFPPQFGNRIDVEKWDKLTYDCEPVDGDAKVVRCTTNGEITIAGYKGGVQTQEGPKPIEPEWIITFEKRDEGEWAPVGVEKKAGA